MPTSALHEDWVAPRQRPAIFPAIKKIVRGEVLIKAAISLIRMWKARKVNEKPHSF